MGFWIYMLIMDLLTPVLMILVGLWFRKHPPKNINAFIGYRTTLSMKNRQTWDFAHKLCGKIWLWTGLLLLPVSVIPFLFVIGMPEDPVGVLGTIVMVLQLLILICSIIPVEVSLHKHFDKDGNAK